MLLLFSGGVAAPVTGAHALITWAEIETADVVVVTPTPTVGPITGGAGWVVKRPTKKKRKTLVDELDDLIAHAKERIVETAEIEDPGLERRRAQLAKATQQALLQSNRDSLVELAHQIGKLRRIIEEIDDEEVLLLMS